MNGMLNLSDIQIEQMAKDCFIDKLKLLRRVRRPSSINGAMVKLWGRETLPNDIILVMLGNVLDAGSCVFVIFFLTMYTIHPPSPKSLALKLLPNAPCFTFDVAFIIEIKKNSNRERKIAR